MGPLGWPETTICCVTSRSYCLTVYTLHNIICICCKCLRTVRSDNDILCKHKHNAVSPAAFRNVVCFTVPNRKEVDSTRVSVSLMCSYLLRTHCLMIFLFQFCCFSSIRIDLIMFYCTWWIGKVCRRGPLAISYKIHFNIIIPLMARLDSSVGIATR
jgi:hypothetical protein